jgi:hypothetical protein
LCIFDFMPEIIRPIYVEKDEGVGSLLSRIQHTSDDTLSLVFPEGSAIFKNILEVELLKNQLNSLGKVAKISTSDKSQEELAKNIGLQIEEEVKEEKNTDKFLEDFYSPNNEKIASPLIKPGMSDIHVKADPSIQPKPEASVVQKLPELNKVEIKIDKSIEVDSFKEEAVISQEAESERKESKDDSPVPIEELRTAPRVEPISLTEEDINSEQENVNKEKKSRKKLSFSKIKLGEKSVSFAGLTKSPLKKIFIILLLGAVFVFFLTATFIFPKVDSTIKPASETAQLNIDVLFDSEAKTVDFEDNVIPSQIFKMTESITQEFQATKQEDIRRNAKGIITIYNGYSSESQALVKSTRFESPDGKIFRIQETVTVPGAKIQGGTIIASSIDVEVVADQAGEAYNISATKFTIPGFKGSDKYSGFSGESKVSMSGGLITSGTVVGDDDVARAESALKDELLLRAKDELIKQMGEDFILIEESLTAEISESTPIPAMGDPSQKFTFTLKALAQGFAYKEEDLSSLIEERIALKISDKRLTLPGTRIIQFTSNDSDFEDGEADFSLAVEEDISWKIDEDRLKDILAGKSQTEAKEAMGLFSEIESASFSLWPFWTSRIPKDIRRIHISIDY